MQSAGLLSVSPSSVHLYTSIASAEKLQASFKYSLLGEKLFSFVTFNITFVFGTDSLTMLPLYVGQFELILFLVLLFSFRAHFPIQIW